MGARRPMAMVLAIIILLMMAVFACLSTTTTTTTWPWAKAVPPPNTDPALALERYAAQSAAEVAIIESAQATATALAESYYATVSADQALHEQQRLADEQLAAAAAAEDQVRADAVSATATASAQQAAATQQAYEWEATAIAQQATATQQAHDWEATAIAQRATATTQALAIAAEASRLVWAGHATATAESAAAALAWNQADARRQAQQDRDILAVWRNYGIPAAFLVLLGCIVILGIYAARQYARRTSAYETDCLQDAAARQQPEDDGQTPAQLVPIPPSTPSATGSRSARIMRRLEEAQRSGRLSGALLDRLEAIWRRTRRKRDE